MKNKIIGTILVIVLSVALLFFGTVLFMFISPGTEVFGIRYVSGTSSNGFLDENKSFENISSTFSVNIKSKSIPVKIKYENTGYVYVRFYQKFIGFTNTKAKTPSVKIDSTSNSISVETNELEKYLIANDDSYLLISIPSGYKNTSFTINSNTSNVSFEGATITPIVNLLSIKTTGEFSVNTKGLNINDFSFIGKYKTINLGDKINVKGFVDFESQSGDLVLFNGTDGNVTFKSVSGSLKIKKCQNLTMTTSTGKLASADTASNLVINGKLKFNSTLGSVDVLKILGEGISEINTEIGNVNVDFAGDLKITGKRGAIKIKSCNVIDLIGEIGNVTIDNVISSAKIETTSGDVKLGSATGKVSNANVKTGLGDIVLTNISGTANAVASKGNISVSGSETMANIVASTNGTFNGVDIIGDVDLSVKGAVNIALKTIGKVVIKGNEGPVNINLISSAVFEYKVTTTNGEGASLIKNNVTENLGKDKASTNYLSTLNKNVITASTVYGKITITIANK
ncbi:MAG: DUF4097 family beta strand repeat-containing protein [Clostridia bacterium]